MSGDGPTTMEIIEWISAIGVSILGFILNLMNICFIFVNFGRMYKRNMLKSLIILFYSFALLGVIANCISHCDVLWYLIEGKEDDVLVDFDMILSAFFMAISFWMISASITLTMYKLGISIQLIIKEINEK